MRDEAVRDVIIVGGGPTGMMLAGELSLAGVDVVVVERRSDQALAGTRAGGLHARTLEVLDQRGLAERFLSQGQTAQIVAVARMPLDLGDFPTRHPYGLVLGQLHIERILGEWLAERAVPFERGRAVTTVVQDEAGVDVVLDDGRTLRARYVVGCDGGRSVLRKHAGIAFPGWDASVSYLIAEVSLRDEPPWGLRHGEKGVQGIGKLDGGRARVVLSETAVEHGETPSVDELRAALVAVYGADFGVHDVTWISRFSDMARQAASYRVGRVLVAGDAAHVHSPVGGQGLNTGVQDAVNLGWKLAQVVRGTSPPGLLDTYHAERHPIGARVLRTTMALTALERGDERARALRESVTELLKMDAPRKHYAGLLSGLDVRYELGGAHPLVGRRVPDLDLITPSGPTRVSTLLHAARPVLIHLGAPGGVRLEGWTDRVHVVEARTDGAWDLPVIGPVAAPAALLIRPDGYVAWVGDPSDPALGPVLAQWFGPPRG